MKKNLGNTDRVVRLVLACALFIIWFEDVKVRGLTGTILLVLAGILVVTSFIGFCPLYRLFGINSIPKKKTES